MVFASSIIFHLYLFLLNFINLRNFYSFTTSFSHLHNLLLLLIWLSPLFSSPFFLLIPHLPPQTTSSTSILSLIYYLIFLYSSPLSLSPHDSFSVHPPIFITIISINSLLLYHRLTVFPLLLLLHLHLQFPSNSHITKQTYQFQRLN